MSVVTALIVPIYQPKDRCISFLSSFSKDEFDYMLVVDDGSGKDYKHIFDAIEKETPFEVLSYLPNGGKGHAMKEGLKYLLEKNPSIDFVLTADGDGQHLKKDILHIRDTALKNPISLTLGVRDMINNDIPKNSKIGGDMSRAYMKWSTHLYCLDTQTGLRAIPSNLFDLFLKTPGERYDFEMNFLVDAARVAKIKEELIETVYENNNEGSHFKPLLDTYRIYKGPIFYFLSLLISWGIDIGLFVILTSFASFGSLTNYVSLAISKVAAEALLILSSIFIAFPKRKGIGARSGKHYFIFLTCLIFSLGSMYFFSMYMNAILLKFLTDLVLYFFFFLVSLLWAKSSTNNFPEDKNPKS